jgi:hypothetical protein
MCRTQAQSRTICLPALGANECDEPAERMPQSKGQLISSPIITVGLECPGEYRRIRGHTYCPGAAIRAGIW